MGLIIIPPSTGGWGKTVMVVRRGKCTFSHYKPRDCVRTLSPHFVRIRQNSRRQPNTWLTRRRVHGNVHSSEAKSRPQIPSLEAQLDPTVDSENGKPPIAEGSLEALLDECHDKVVVPLRKPPAPADGPPEKWPSGANRGVAKVRYTHDAMIDMIIADPCVTQNELAARFGYTAGWVSQIIASDAFQARLAERNGELVDPTIRATVEERFKGIVMRSLEILREKLDRPTHQIPDNLALRSIELSSRALGYGARDSQPAASQVSVEVHLENLGDNLTRLLQRKKSLLPPIEGEAADA